MNSISNFIQSEFQKRSEYILGISYGNKTIKGKKTEEKSIIYYVNKKESIYRLNPNHIINKDVLINNKKITTDIVECKIETCAIDGGSPWTDWQSTAPSNRGGFNPIKGGIEISNYTDLSSSSGTLGFIAKQKDDLSLVGVSASHILLSDSFYTSERDPLKGVFYDSYLSSGHEVVQPIGPTPEPTSTPQSTPSATLVGVAPTPTPMPTPGATATNRAGNKIGYIKKYNPLKNNLGTTSKNYCDTALVALEESVINNLSSWKQEGLSSVTSAPSFASTSEIDTLLSDPSTELLSSGKTTGGKGEGSIKLKPAASVLHASLTHRLQEVSTFIEVNDCFTFKANDGTNDIYFPVAEGDSGSAVIAQIGSEYKIIGMVIGAIKNSSNNKVEEAICSRIDKISEELNIESWDGSTIGITYSKNEEGEYFILQGKPWSNQKTINFSGKEYWQAGLVDCREYPSMPTPTPSPTPSATPIPGGHLTLEGDAYYPTLDFFGCSSKSPEFTVGASGGIEFAAKYGRAIGINSKGSPSGSLPSSNNPRQNNGHFEFRGNTICWLNVDGMLGNTMSWRLGTFKQADVLSKHIWGSAVAYNSYNNSYKYYKPCSDRFAYSTSVSSSNLSQNWKVCNYAGLYKYTGRINYMALRGDGRHIHETSYGATLSDCSRNATSSIGGYHAKSISNAGTFAITNGNTVIHRPPLGFSLWGGLKQVGRMAYDGSNNTAMARHLYCDQSPASICPDAYSGWLVINLNTLISLAPYSHRNPERGPYGGDFGAWYDPSHRGLVGGNNFFALHARGTSGTSSAKGLVHIVGRWFNSYKNWSNGRYTGGWMPWARQSTLSRNDLPASIRSDINTYGTQICSTPQNQTNSYLVVQSSTNASSGGSNVPDVFSVYDMRSVTRPSHRITFQLPWRNSSHVAQDPSITNVTRAFCVDSQGGNLSIYLIAQGYNSQTQRSGKCILNINAFTGHVISKTWSPGVLNKKIIIADSETTSINFGETISCNGNGKVAVGCDASYKERAGNNKDYYPSNRAILVYNAQLGGPRSVSTSSLSGALIDGYIKNASGRLIDLQSQLVVRTFKTNASGQWSLDIPKNEIPEVYKIEFLPGGIDSITNKVVNSTFSNVSTRAATENLSSKTINITPITSLKTGITESKIENSTDSSVDFDALITESVSFIAEAFNIDQDSIDQDFIKEQNSSALKVNSRLNLITETLTISVKTIDPNVTADNIFDSIIQEFSSQSANNETPNDDILTSPSNIENIVQNSTAISVASNNNSLLNAKTLLPIISQNVEDSTGADFSTIMADVAKTVKSAIEHTDGLDLTVEITDSSALSDNLDSAKSVSTIESSLIPTPVPTGTSTPTPSPTLTLPAPTASPTGTSAPTPTPTPSGTGSTPTPTASPTPTPTPSDTSPTPTPTVTPTGTSTPAPTATPTGTSNVTNMTVTVSAGKFLINGGSQATLSLSEGQTYKFDQSDSTNSSHPLRFSSTSDGTHGGGSEYTTGVSSSGSAGSSGAYIQIIVDTGAPTLFYYCANHSGLGGQINTP